MEMSRKTEKLLTQFLQNDIVVGYFIDLRQKKYDPLVLMTSGPVFFDKSQ